MADNTSRALIRVVSVLEVPQIDRVANPLRARMICMKVTESMATRLVNVLLTAALILCANHACADDRNLLPKYGGLPETAIEKEINAKFISGMDEDYHGDRKKGFNGYGHAWLAVFGGWRS